VADRTVVEIQAYGVTADAVQALRRVQGVAAVAVEERDQAQVLQVQAANGLQLTQALLARLDGARVGRVAAREPTLEDAYVDLVTEGAKA
jgi:ABC-2 type transport system ATP-binding protein